MSWKVNAEWTLFLDRDGVINRRNFEGYITQAQDFHFIPGVLSALKEFSALFGRVIVVTNQQGVGKKIMTQCNLNEIHGYMQREIKNNGGRIDAVYSATNLRNASPNHRKPASYMGLKAQEDFPDIDFKKSIMVGDTDSDIAFGQNLGMKTVLIKSDEKTMSAPDIVVNDMVELYKKLLK